MYIPCREVPATAPASWQKLKICHGATARGLNIDVSAEHSPRAHMLFVDAQWTLGDFAKEVIFMPIWRCHGMLKE
jgi:hypothetical protein